MANIDEILAYERNQGCSDVHIGEDTGITLRLDGQLKPYIQEFSNEGRYRVNIYFQQEHITVAIRIINNQIKSLEELKLPPVLV